MAAIPDGNCHSHRQTAPKMSQTPVWTPITPKTGALFHADPHTTRVRDTNTNGEGLAFSFDQTLNGLEYLAVVKGAPNRDNAMKFVAHMMKPETQAATMSLTGDTPVSKSALPKMSEDARKWFPDMSNPNNVVLNDAWWADNFETVTRRFKEWMLL